MYVRVCVCAYVCACVFKLAGIAFCIIHIRLMLNTGPAVPGYDLPLQTVLMKNN